MQSKQLEVLFFSIRTHNLQGRNNQIYKTTFIISLFCKSYLLSLYLGTVKLDLKFSYLEQRTLVIWNKGL